MALPTRLGWALRLPGWHPRRVKTSVASPKQQESRLIFPDPDELPRSAVVLMNAPADPNLSLEDAKQILEYLLKLLARRFAVFGLVGRTLVIGRAVSDWNRNEPALQETVASPCRDGGRNIKLTPIEAVVTPIVPAIDTVVKYLPAGSIAANCLIIEWEKQGIQGEHFGWADPALTIMPAGSIEIRFHVMRCEGFVCIVPICVGADLQDRSKFIISIDTQFTFEEKVGGVWRECPSRWSLLPPVLHTALPREPEKPPAGLVAFFRSLLATLSATSNWGPLELKGSGNPDNGKTQGPSNRGSVIYESLRRRIAQLVGELTQGLISFARDPECLDGLTPENVNNFFMNRSDAVAFWTKEPEGEIAVHLVAALRCIPVRNDSDKLVIACEAPLEPKPFGHQRFLLDLNQDSDLPDR